MQDVPLLKGRKLDDRITIPIDRETKAELYALKVEKGVDILEWARIVIRRELPGLKKRVSG